MSRVQVPYDHKLDETLALLRNPGLLLASTKADGKSNVMTIGWGTVGVIWGLDIFVVMVRPSRYTYEFIEESGVFTVNVPSPELREFCRIAGSRSGRDMDKFAEFKLSTTPGRNVPAVTIDACPLAYECQVVHHNDVIPANLSPDVEAKSYRGHDYHRIYYGQIMGVWEKVAEK